MKILIMAGSITIPILMFFLQKTWRKFRLLWNGLAIICLLIFGNISAFAILNIIKSDTVFMTDIHAVFLNPFFLLTGAYLGVYTLYLLFLLTLDE